jgi:hypothetical protein
MSDAAASALNLSAPAYDEDRRAMENHHPLPTLGRVVSALMLSLLLALAAAVQVVQSLGSVVGTVAALPLGLLVFVVLGAVSLVLTARLDERWNR